MFNPRSILLPFPGMEICLCCQSSSSSSSSSKSISSESSSASQSLSSGGSQSSIGSVSLSQSVSSRSSESHSITSGSGSGSSISQSKQSLSSGSGSSGCSCPDNIIFDPSGDIITPAVVHTGDSILITLTPLDSNFCVGTMTMRVTDALTSEELDVEMVTWDMPSPVSFDIIIAADWSGKQIVINATSTIEACGDLSVDSYYTVL